MFDLSALDELEFGLSQISVEKPEAHAETVVRARVARKKAKRLSAESQKAIEDSTHLLSSLAIVTQ